MKQKLPKIIIIAILSLITALVWAFFDITRAIFKKPDVKVEEITVVPVDPNLDIDTLNSLQNSIFFEEGEVNEVLTPPSPEAEPIPEPISEPTTDPSFEEFIEPEESPEPSPEGTL